MQNKIIDVLWNNNTLPDIKAQLLIKVFLEDKLNPEIKLFVNHMVDQAWAGDPAKRELMNAFTKEVYHPITSQDNKRKIINQFLKIITVGTIN